MFSENFWAAETLSLTNTYIRRRDNATPNWTVRVCNSTLWMLRDQFYAVQGCNLKAFKCSKYLWLNSVHRSEDYEKLILVLACQQCWIAISLAKWWQHNPIVSCFEVMIVRHLVSKACCTRHWTYSKKLNLKCFVRNDLNLNNVVYSLVD